MADLPAHKRRPRYRGKNPGRFGEKYKEHAPERHAETVAKVIAAGKTPAGSHRPIMVAEILEILATPLAQASRFPPAVRSNSSTTRKPPPTSSRNAPAGPGSAAAQSL